MEFIIFGSSHLIGLFFSIKENSFVRNNDFETISTNIYRILNYSLIQIRIGSMALKWIITF